MSSFDNREKAFENKFAHDAELKFKAEARRNKLVGTWAASKLGLTGEAVDAYVKDVRRADLAEAGDDDVVRKIMADFKAKGVNVAESELRTAMSGFLADAVSQIERGG